MKLQLVPPFVVTHTPSWQPAALPHPLLLFGVIDPTCA